ncbi:unnamed protein product [Peniophora sp. CBMAI 1063]|nr:unnamed protein product [Peniophora sp. CBMAI 1063]
MLLSLPPETIEKVVAFVASQEIVGGPPPGLFALMLTCRYMHYLLSPEHNPGRFYRLFHDRFDLAAPQRRAHCLPSNPVMFSTEARQRFASLKLIRARRFNHPEMLRSLLVAYVMISEDDGTNGMHLRWAGLREFLQTYLMRGDPGPDLNDVWSLAAILQTQWSFSDSLRSESEDERDTMLSLLDPHLFGQLHNKPVLHHGSCSSSSSSPCMSEASSRKLAISQFGHSIDVNTPAIAPYAILSFVLRVERYKLANPQNVPSARSERLGFGPTKEDFDQYNAACQTHAVSDSSPIQSTSSQNDVDWARLIYMNATLPSGTTVRPFRIGALAGSWDGTLLLPSLHPVQSDSDPPRGLGPVEYLSRQPIALELHEHYSYSPLSPNVCCKQAFEAEYVGPPVLCECALNLHGQCLENDARLSSRDTSCPASVYTCDCIHELNESAVTDISVTGVTPPDFGAAWGAYRFKGRVRISDGLIVLRRDPIGSSAASPAWLFGYVLGSRQLVGRWHVGSPGTETPWEGVFGLWKSVT